MAALIWASVPVNVMDVSPVPVPLPKVKPVLLASEIVPWATLSVTVSVLVPASTSDTDSPLMVSAALALVACAAGTTSTGA